MSPAISTLVLDPQAAPVVSVPGISLTPYTPPFSSRSSSVNQLNFSPFSSPVGRQIIRQAHSTDSGADTYSTPRHPLQPVPLASLVDLENKLSSTSRRTSTFSSSSRAIQNKSPDDAPKDNVLQRNRSTSSTDNTDAHNNGTASDSSTSSTGSRPPSVRGRTEQRSSISEDSLGRTTALSILSSSTHSHNSGNSSNNSTPSTPSSTTPSSSTTTPSDASPSSGNESPNSSSSSSTSTPPSNNGYHLDLNKSSIDNLSSGAKEKKINVDGESNTLHINGYSAEGDAPGPLKKYKAVFDDSKWEALIQHFRRDFLALHGLSFNSLLEITVQTGVSALKTPRCGQTETSNIDCPTCYPLINHVVQGVTPTERTRSCLVCRIDGSVMDENNTPLVLPNGYLYSKNALTKMAAEHGGKVKCPMTEQEFPFTECRTAYIL